MTAAVAKIIQLCICPVLAAAPLVATQDGRDRTAKFMHHAANKLSPATARRTKPAPVAQVAAASAPCEPAVAGVTLVGTDLVPTGSFTEVAPQALPQVGSSEPPRAVFVPGGDYGTGGGSGYTPAAPSASPAPEPTNWALMIVGFGTAGGVIRWRRAVAL